MISLLGGTGGGSAPTRVLILFMSAPTTSGIGYVLWIVSKDRHVEVWMVVVYQQKVTVTNHRPLRIKLPTLRTGQLVLPTVR